MSQDTWGHGYFEDCRYTCGFYRETAPNWLDFCAIVRGIRPPREFGSNFRYLELGSGMGYNLCLLAAAYPEGSFVGIDFNADQIAHSKDLADRLNLDNVEFKEIDFIALAQSSDERTGFLKNRSFDYISLHGVLTWVTEPVQRALVLCIERFIKTGGLVYCSYNTNPGWQAGAIFRQIAEYERRHEPRSTPDKAYERARQKLATLLSYDDNQPSSLARQAPAVEGLITEISKQSPYYLLHEYANSGWCPLYVDDAHALLATRQIQFIGSGNPPELLPDLIPVKIRTLLDSESDITSRELLYDIATCRRFRRDIFTRGRCAMTSLERNKRLESMMFIDSRSSDHAFKPLQTDFGEVSADGDTITAVFQQLSRNPCSLKVLSEAIGHSLEHTAGLISMLLSQGAVGIASPGTAGACPSGQAINIKLAQLIREGCPYGYLSAPGIGSALPITTEQADALLHHLQQGNSPAAEGIQPLLPLLTRVACLS